MSEIAIEVKNICVKYKEHNIKYADGGYFTAISDMSFSVAKGQIVGIAGKNGSGKSTLLRCIAGTYEPDSGTVNLHGTVSLLSIGKGFNNNLSGRDNIYLSGSLYGLSKKQIDSCLDDIVSFAELEDYIDKPVRSYSSGMYSRLAFAIAMYIRTDIILLDEILSVGDKNFKNKSLTQLREVLNDGQVTAMIVSHNTKLLRTLCTEIIWIDKGKIMKTGPADEILDEYEHN